VIEMTAQGGNIASPSPDQPCQSCGACCSYSSSWPRFSLEDDAALARIPAKYVAASGSGMACTGDRCTALRGEVGKATACGIYADRPDVCRACEPGDEACSMARAHHGLAPLPAAQ
jgi:Fe-S-cluster containining protein